MKKGEDTSYIGWKTWMSMRVGWYTPTKDDLWDVKLCKDGCSFKCETQESAQLMSMLAEIREKLAIPCGCGEEEE